MSSDDLNGGDSVGTGEEDERTEDGTRGDEDDGGRSKRKAEENDHQESGAKGGGGGGESAGDEGRDSKKARTGGVRTLKLSGLPWKATEADVRKFLTNVSIVDGSISIIEDGCYVAYVSVGSEEEEANALKLNRTHLGRRIVEVSKSSDADRSKRVSSGSGEAGVLRLRGLPYSASEQDVKNFFAGYALTEEGGKSVHFIPDASGRSSGQAYVIFKNETEAQCGQKLDKEKLGERWLDIFPSTLAEFNTTVNRGRPSADYGRGGGYTAAAAPQAQRPIGSASGGPSDMSSLSFVAKVRGLPFDCTRADLLYFFRDTDIKDNGVFFVSRMDGKASGEAFVVFHSLEGLRRALALDKQKMRDRWLDIFESNQADLVSRVGMAVALSNKADAAYQGVLKLRGLPYSTSVADIKDFFTGFSVIDHGIFITNGPDGRASGEAFVVLTSEHEALRARDALNKKSIQNRWVELIQVAKGDLYTATVASPIINHFSNCPVYANVAMTCVRLRNLPSDVKEEDLFRFFHGLNVIGLYICRDHSARSTGEAYAEFGSLDDCQQAMSRNRERMNPSERMPVEVQAVSKEEVMELIEAEKRGDVGAYMGYRGGAAGRGGAAWGGPPPGGYAAMARGGPPAGGYGGGGYGAQWQQQPQMHAGGGGYADRLGDRGGGGYRRDDRRW